MNKIHVKWESNSRVNALLAEGKIKANDIIKRTTTDNFPFEAATVRMKNVRHKLPHVTVHIRGKKQTRTGWNNQFSYDYGATCRINFGGQWQGKPNTAMDSNGDLEEGLSWLDVHNVVTEVKEAMGMK
jgi:hypothetical protein|tara:strand:+ start:1627 stop:2010 length:384 start_codon:yes stop_codon:yes gene_type:complete